MGPISGPVASALADIIPKIIIIRMHGEIMWEFLWIKEYTNSHMARKSIL